MKSYLTVFIQEAGFQNVIWEMVAILYWPQLVNIAKRNLFSASSCKIIHAAGRNYRNFTDGISKCIFLNEQFYILAWIQCYLFLWVHITTSSKEHLFWVMNSHRTGHKGLISNVIYTASVYTLDAVIYLAIFCTALYLKMIRYIIFRTATRQRISSVLWRVVKWENHIV